MSTNHLDITLTNSEECTICLERIHDIDKVDILPCNHAFHSECIDEWYKTSGTEILNDDTVSIEWHCPLCRYTMTESINVKNDTVFYFSIVKFRRKRAYIKLFTLLDSSCSFLSFAFSGNIFYILWCVCSLYGYSGAHNFNIEHLRLYSCFCIMPFMFKIVHLYMYFLTELDDIIVYPPNEIFISMTSSFISLIFQLYLIKCIYFLSIHLSLFEDRIRQYIEE